MAFRYDFAPGRFYSASRAHPVSITKEAWAKVDLRIIGCRMHRRDWKCSRRLIGLTPHPVCRVLHNLLLEDLSSFIPHGSLVFLQSNQPSCPILFVSWCLHNASSFAWKAPSWSSTNLCLINPGAFFRSLLKCNFLQEKFSHPQEQVMSLVFSLSSHRAFHLWYSYCLPETRHYSKCLLYILTHLIPMRPNAISTIVFE